MNNQIETKPKIVVFGGGTGLSVLLRGLKHFDVDITAIVTVADDGGSTGKIREELGIPAPGDVRNVITALSEVEPLTEKLFSYRFSSKVTGTLSGHSFGNLFLAALTEITGDFVHAVREMSKVLNVKGKVLPSANQSIVLHAEMTDGTIVSGESKIPKAEKKIKRVFLTPENIKPLNRTKREILNADMILIGPGSLYTSILPNLIIPHLSEVIAGSKAKKIYICNMMTEHGETDNYKASDHLQALIDHVGNPCIDIILVSNRQVPEDIQLKYKEELAYPVIIDIDRLEKMKQQVMTADIMKIDDNAVRHDTNKLAQLLYDLLKKD